MKTINLIIAKIVLISITMICNTYISLTQTQTTINKQTIVKQDTIVVKSLPWKEEYEIPKEKWEKKDMEWQKEWIIQIGFDAEAAYNEQVEKCRKENEELKKQLGIKNDTIKKKK